MAEAYNVTGKVSTLVGNLQEEQDLVAVTGTDRCLLCMRAVPLIVVVVVVSVVCTVRCWVLPLQQKPSILLLLRLHLHPVCMPACLHACA